MEFILLILLVGWIFIAPILAMMWAHDAKREIARLETELIKLAQANRKSPAPDAPSAEPTPPPLVEKIRVRPPPTPMPMPAEWQDEPELEQPAPTFSLEQFMGAKLFAWLGGLAMFFGVVLFVKYAFENNLIPPPWRIALGYVAGSALLGGGMLVHRLPRYRVLAQAFCATGVVILYGVTFAAHAIYHFPAFGTAPTFVLMSAITLTAFLLAVRMNALVVAVLGMLGGFLTPLLLSTGRDQPLALFGYIALLDIGLLAVSRFHRWKFLTPCAAAGTLMIQIFWYLKFFDRGGYDKGSLTYIPMGILLGFAALFAAAAWIDRKSTDAGAKGSVLGLTAACIGFAFIMLFHSSVSSRPGLLFGFLLLAQLPLLVTYYQGGLVVPALASLACSAHLGWWTAANVTSENLPLTLLVHLAFGSLFALFRRDSKISAIAGISTFLLLAAIPSNLSIPSPNLLFRAALAMSVILAGLWISGRQGGLVLAALLGTLAVEAAWQACCFDRQSPLEPLGWHVGIYLVFLAAPFIFRHRAASQTLPWTAAALSGVGHFLLVHHVIDSSFPNDGMGLVPAAFAIPSLAAFFGLLRMFPELDAPQRSRLAWFGGVSLLFLTLIIPIQFERQWITVGWALEGAALVWLFRRVPHPGLRLTGVALLVIAFVRLALNPAVLNAYPTSELIVVNWHLYTFGIVAAAHIAGALLLRGTPPAVRGLLFTLAGILLFLLLNIEIADAFTPAGRAVIDTSFSGNFARDMTYSIAWGLFALVLLVIGFVTRSRHARYAAIGLLGVTLLKLFLHDLATIQNIFRIGALIGVALIAFAASFLYQRFQNRR